MNSPHKDQRRGALMFSAMLLWKLVIVNHQRYHMLLLDSLFMMVTGQYSALSIYRGNFSLKNSRKTLHSSPVRARYGVSLVGANSGRRVTVVIIAFRALSCYTWLRYIESLQYDIYRSVSIFAVYYRYNNRQTAGEKPSHNSKTKPEITYQITEQKIYQSCTFTIYFHFRFP